MEEILGCALYLGENFKVNKALFIGESEERYPNKPGGDFDFHMLVTNEIFKTPEESNLCYDACIKYHGNVTGKLEQAIAQPFRLPAGAVPAGYDTYLESICADIQNLPRNIKPIILYFYIM